MCLATCCQASRLRSSVGFITGLIQALHRLSPGSLESGSQDSWKFPQLSTRGNCQLISPFRNMSRYRGECCQSALTIQTARQANGLNAVTFDPIDYPQKLTKTIGQV